MKKFLLTLMLLFPLLATLSSLSAAAVMPQISTGTTEYWYHIIFQRYNADLAMQDNGADAVLTVQNFVINQDNQLWKVEDAAVSGQYVLTSKLGRKVYYNGTRFAAGTTSTNFKFIASANTTYTNSWELQRDGSTLGMNPNGGSSAGKQIAEYNIGDGGNPLKFVSVKDALLNKITEATNRLNNTAQGADPGKFNSTSRTNLQTAIGVAQGVYNNSSASDTNFANAYSTLNTAITTYNSEVIIPQISTPGNERWYFLQGTRPANTYLTSTGPGAQLLSKPVIPDSTQLWKFVANTSGTANGIALVNKATGEYLNANAANNTNIFSVATMPTNNLRFIVSTIITNKTARFWIEHATGSTPAFRLHAGNTSVMNWTGNANDNSSWLIMDYTVALKVFLQTSITDAQKLLDNTKEGTDFGNYTATNRSNLNIAIVLAQAELEKASPTDAELKAANSALNAAISTYKAAINKNPVSLLSTNPENYRWYSIRSYATDQSYCLGKVISTGTRAVGEKYTFELKSSPVSDGQLFRFELTGDQTKVLNIIDKKGNYLASNGAIAVEPTAGNDFALTPLSDGVAFWIKPTSLNAIHAQNNGSHIVNWESYAGSASAWVFDFEKEAPIIPRVPEERTVTVKTSNILRGTAVITGTTNTSVLTDYESVSVTANPVKGFFFKAWLNEAGDTISTTNPFIYKGPEAITLVAHFEKGYYPEMMRKYTAQKPYMQQAERYLASATANVNGKDQFIIFETLDNPNPLDISVTTNQIVGNAVVNATKKPIVVHGTSDLYFNLTGANIGLNDGLEWTQQNMFIDWNNDFDFLDEGESLGVISDNTVKTGITRNITIPRGQKNGLYRVRVIYHEPADAADWSTSIWSTNIIQNGVAYDFDIFYDMKENRTPAKPLVSTVEQPVYYLIESASDGLVNLNATTPGTNYLGNLVYAPTANNNTIINHGPLTTILSSGINIDNALWQMVNEGGIVKLKNKGTGLYLDEARWGRTNVTSPFSAVALNSPATQYALKNANQASPAVAWYSATDGYHLNRWGVYYPNSQVAWYFVVAPGSQLNYDEVYPAAVKDELAGKIASLQNFFDNTKEGQIPGTFSVAARKGLTGAISAAQAVHNNPSSTIQSYQAAMAQLETAKAAYLALVNKPVVSDATNTKWYLIQGTRPANTYMSSTGAGMTVKSLALVPDDSQMWKFVSNPNGSADGLALVNKATGEYLNADGASNTILTTVAAMPVINLRNIASDIYTDGIARFWIENTGSPVSVRVHAGNSGVMNWYGNAYDNSSWLILDYSTVLKSALAITITNAQKLLANSVDGSDFGQYSGTGRTALTTAISVAQAAYADEAKTEQEISDANTALNTAMTNYKTTCNTNPVSLLAANPKHYRWYWIRSYATNSNAAYCFGKVISAGARAVGEKYTFEAKTEQPSDAQLFRFELTEDKTNVLNIIDKKGNYMASNGAIATSSTVDNNFALTLLEDGIAFWIKPTTLNPIHAQQSGSHIVNWMNTAGSASAWVFDFAMETIPTGVGNTTAGNYHIYSSNGILKVEGVEEFELYSVTGQRQNIYTPLKKGVYIVKIKDYSQKVIVK